MRNAQIESRVIDALDRRSKAEIVRIEVQVPAKTEVLKDSRGQDHIVVVEEEVKKTRYSGAGEAVVDTFATIDRFNVIDMDCEEPVIGNYMVRDYDILPEFTVFVRPAKVVAPGISGSKSVDLLKNCEAIDISGEGKVLSPEQFHTAQLTILKALNYRCNRLTGLQSVDRVIVDLNDKIVKEYPVVINGRMMAVEKADHLQQFVLAYKFMKDSAYIYDTEDEVDVKDKVEGWVRLLSERAADRNALSTEPDGAKGSNPSA